MNKILIIEDNDAIRENTAELLEMNDYLVLTAVNGNQGFALAKKYLPDLILCDMMMPETDGRKFLKMAKGDAETQNIPLVFFSAGTLSTETQKELAASAKGFLKKPFAEEDLLNMITGLLN